MLRKIRTRLVAVVWILRSCALIVYLLGVHALPVLHQHAHALETSSTALAEAVGRQHACACSHHHGLKVPGAQAPGAQAAVAPAKAAVRTLADSYSQQRSSHCDETCAICSVMANGAFNHSVAIVQLASVPLVSIACDPFEPAPFEALLNLPGARGPPTALNDVTRSA